MMVMNGKFAMEETSKLKEILKNNKKYTPLDYIKIPIMVCPLYTMIICINRIISALIPTINLLITTDFVDTALGIFRGEQSKSAIFRPLILYMLIIAYMYLNSAVINNFVNIRFNMSINRKVRKEVVEKLGRLEYKHIENSSTWDLISRTINDSLGKLARGMNNLLDVLELTIRILSILIILITHVWWIGLIILILIVPLLYLAKKGGREIYQANQEAQKYRRRAIYLHNVLSRREYVYERSLFNYVDDINNKWHEKFEEARKINLNVEFKNFVRMKGSSIVTMLIAMLIIGVLIWPLSAKEITAGMFIGLTTAALDLVGVMSWKITLVTRIWAENLEYLKDLTKFMELSEKEGALDIPRKAEELTFNNIEFKNVSFKYPGTDKYILKDFNLTLKEGLHYAFVGINGAGKTTLTKLLTGMYDNFDGEININDKSIKEYKLAELKAMFSVVYQDFAKYYIKLKDNILLGNVSDLEAGKINENNINAITDSIGLNDEIKHLQEGLDTHLGKIKKRGIDLSGGQWQRLAVARTLYSPALVRILDEPTAALDPIAESNIYKLFGDISKGKSTIFITHRLGAAKLADEIIVIDEGKVSEHGSHEELLNRGGIYAAMYESQRSWYQ